ncbi:hypothetical protein O181_013067 [Austropuccinia psidii MF-1]|uniref:Uncharacterized protein n=1 Tax=Austropuccinia psidii MF-1 TaxID=1389203 RepID=A0A9Q3GNK9_9BASI|nr:hypothetical protein [Austropuccinia psidii MF-1]
MVTINNNINVFINELIQLEPSIVIQTPQYPQGRRVFVHVGCLLGDLVDNHKVAGFASHSATRFCSWCDSPKADIKQQQVGRLRQKQLVKDYSRAFKDLKNKAEQTRMVNKSGIRWSELNRLDYWDPVSMIPIGVMHNWFEGILQQNFRNRWKWDFENEEQEHDSGDDFEMQDADTSVQAGLSWQKANKMMSALSNVKVPFGVTHIPQWLGQAKAGKIKESEWQSLFSIYLPLTALDILLGYIDKLLENPNETGKTCILINNFSALVACTHILEAQSITNDLSLRFGEEYWNYCETSRTLFPGYTINPNHHYALHIEKQLKWWGPLNGVLEFAGERLNGILQQIPASGKVGKFGSKIMKSFCQWQRLLRKDDWDISEPKKNQEVDFEMYQNTYMQLLLHLQKTTPNLCDYSQIPHPEGAKIFLNYAKELASIRKNGYLIGSLERNNLIHYISQHQIRFGRVVHIMKVMTKASKDELLVVQKLDKAQTQWDGEQWLQQVFEKVMVTHLRDTNQVKIVPKCHILGTCAYRDLPKGSMCCKQCSVFVQVIKKGGHGNQ